MNSSPVIPPVPPATPEDIQAIIETAQDYAEGWFTANAERMRRCLHPDLVKRSIWHDQKNDKWNVRRTLTAEIMVEYTREGGGSEHPAHEKVFDVEVLDVFLHIATVKVLSYPYMDYLHIAKMDGRWQIVHCLYALREGVETEP